MASSAVLPSSAAGHTPRPMAPCKAFPDRPGSLRSRFPLTKVKRPSGALPEASSASSADSSYYGGIDPTAAPAVPAAVAAQNLAAVNGQGTGLSKNDYGKFVQFFRQASPYIEGHRGRTFVIVIPGEVSRAASIPNWRHVTALTQQHLPPGCRGASPDAEPHGGHRLAARYHSC
jgi:hypothetical protein